MAAALGAGAQSGAYNEQATAYINKYKAWAIEEQQRTGVPAAITLAQGIHETQAGTSELATEANNHFGIKCKKSWMGETFSHTDDAPDECFRKYARAYDSYKDHSDYLKQSPRYARCFEQDVTDYAAWAQELKAAGYATNPKYAQKLVRVIEDFHLQDFTYAAMKAPQPQGEGLAAKIIEEAPARAEEPRRTVIIQRREPAVSVVKEEKIAPAQAQELPTANEQPAIEDQALDIEPEPIYGTATMRNNLRGFYARKGDVLLEAAIKYNMRYAKLLELNDLPDAPLEADLFVYTEKKRGLGIRSKHIVKEGETLVQVAQAEGIQLRQLRLLNNLEANEEPTPGAVLNLQVAAAAKPETTVQSRGADKPAQATLRSDNSDMIATGNKPAEVVPDVDAAPVKEEQDVPETETIPVAAPVAAKIPEEVMPMPVTKTEPKRTQPTPQPARQKTYTIADELAVGEDAPKYSPRYRGADAGSSANSTGASDAASQPPVTAPEEPQDDFSRLKARLDKAVYAPKKEAKPAQQQVATAPVTTAGKQEGMQQQTTVSGNSEARRFHTVKAGDTAYGIARENNISMKQLMEWNNLNFEALKTGQKLRVR